MGDPGRSSLRPRRSPSPRHPSSSSSSTISDSDVPLRPPPLHPCADVGAQRRRFGARAVAHRRHHVGYRPPRRRRGPLCGDARAVGVRQDDRGDCGGVEQGGRGGPRGCCRCASARRHAAPRRAVRRLTARTASPPASLPARRSRTRTRTSCCRSSPSAAAARCSRRSSSPRTSSASARRSRAAARTTATRSRRTSAAGERPSPPEPYSASLSVVLRDFMKRRTRVRADRTFLATLAPARKFS